MRKQRGIDKSVRLARVVRRVEQGLQFNERELLRDAFVVREHVVKSRASGHGLLRCMFYERMRVEPANTASITASPRINPCVRSRLVASRPAFTSIFDTIAVICASAPPVRRARSGNAS